MQFSVKNIYLLIVPFLMVATALSGYAQTVHVTPLPDTLPANISLNILKSSFIPQISLSALADSLQSIAGKDSVFITSTATEDFFKSSANKKEERRVIQPYIQFSNAVYQKKANIISVTTLLAQNQQIEYKNKTDFVASYTVQPLDSSNYSVLFSIDKFNTSFETMGVEMRYHSDSSASYNTGNLHNGLQNVIGTPLEITISDKGIIRDIDTSNITKRIKNTIDNLYIGNENFLIDEQFPITHLLPGQLVIGETWNTHYTTDDLQVQTTYSVKDFFRDNVILDIQSDIKQKTQLQSGDKSYSASFSGVQTGEIEIGMKTGLVLKRNLKISMEGQVNTDTEPVEAKTIINITDTLQ